MKMKRIRTAASAVVLGLAMVAWMVTPGGATDPALTEVSNAKNVFVDGVTQVDRPMPSTPSASQSGATVAALTLDPGRHVLFASIVFSGNVPSRIVTCLLTPVNGPTAKAEWQPGIALTQPTAQTLFATTTNKGAGTATLNCTDTDSNDASGPVYRFVQLTAIEVPKLKRAAFPAP